MQIGKKDVIWNYSATILKVASSVIILPIILKWLTPNEVGMWTIFLSFFSIILLFDLGFNQTFARNITYVFSGANQFQKSGYEIVEEGTDVNFALLKSTIRAMKWFYIRISLIILIFLLTVGTYYIHYIILKSYTGDGLNIYVAWILYSILISYQAYTLYYESLLIGKGLIKRNKQIIVIAQLFYIIVSLSLIMIFNLGLLALVIGQAASILTNRLLSYATFYDSDTKKKIQEAEILNHKDVINNISPNAIKIGITSLGSFLVNKSSIFVGSLFLPLSVIASFGISKQIVDVIVTIASISFSTFYPKMIQYRVNNNLIKLKQLYTRSKIVYFISYIVMGTLLVIFGNTALAIIKTNTLLLPNILLMLLLLVTFLENNHSWAGSILLTKNEVPFFKASIFAGLFALFLLFLFILHLKLGVISLILAPGIAQLVYQNWKWPLEVKKDLKIKIKDYVVETKLLMNKLWMFRLS